MQILFDAIDKAILFYSLFAYILHLSSRIGRFIVCDFGGWWYAAYSLEIFLAADKIFYDISVERAFKCEYLHEYIMKENIISMMEFKQMEALWKKMVNAGGIVGLRGPLKACQWNKLILQLL